MKLAIIIFILCNIISMQANAADADDIKTFNAAQSAGNVTASTWNTELLDYQAKYLTEKGEKDAKQAFIEHGGNAADLVESATYESSFVFIKGENILPDLRRVSPAEGCGISICIQKILWMQGT